MPSTKTPSKKVQTMKNSKFHDFFLDELKDIYWAENALIKALPIMSKAASSSKLVKAIDSHLEETKTHVARLEQVFKLLGEKAEQKKCEAMTGILKEAKEVRTETADDQQVQDAAIIVCCQKAEHYEIASYGSLAAFAEAMGHMEVIPLFEQTLKEEKAADKALSKIAFDNINEEAAED